MTLSGQALLSGTNFILAITLARYCAVEEYGAYMVAFSAMLALNGIQAALICEPITYLCASLDKRAAAEYTTSLMIAQTVLSLCSTALVGIGLLYQGIYTTAPVAASTAQGLLMAIAAVQFREFFRRLLLSRFLLVGAMITDGVYCFTILLGLFLVFQHGLPTAERALYVMGAAAGVSSLLSAGLLRNLLGAPISGKALKSMLVSNWSFGRWQLLGAAGSYGYMQASTFMVAAILGTGSTAELHAARNLLLPIQVLITGVGNYVSPRAACLYIEEGRHGLQSFVSRWGAVLSGIAAVYCVIVFCFPSQLLNILYEGKYASAVPLVRLWAVVFLLFALRRVPTIGLVALRRPDIPVLAGIAAGLIALLIYKPAILWCGVSGAVVVRVVAEASILGITMFGLLRKGIEHRPTVITNQDKRI